MMRTRTYIRQIESCKPASKRLQIDRLKTYLQCLNARSQLVLSYSAVAACPIETVIKNTDPAYARYLLVVVILEHKHGSACLNLTGILLQHIVQAEAVEQH